jgi:hypothetical protein
MAKLVYGLSQSLDGYVDHMKLGPPVPTAFGHFIEQVRGLTGLIYRQAEASLNLVIFFLRRNAMLQTCRSTATLREKSPGSGRRHFP